MKTPDVIVRGRDDGEGMVIWYQTERGTDIFGLGVPNTQATSDWGGGPTWCYLIDAEKVTLIDTGRPGTFHSFQALLQTTGKRLSDIDRVVVTHSHEDHDGNLADILASGHADLWAHPVYQQMINVHPDIFDGAPHPNLPGSCRMCSMPSSFHRNCLPHLAKRSQLEVDVGLEDNDTSPNGNLRCIFTPGHAPDSICLILEDEVLFVGDNILHEVTPHPTLEYAFTVNRRILPECYRYENTLYGLMVYLESLQKLSRLEPSSFSATFPAHRLFYNGQFNLIADPSARAREIIRFHIQRCGDLLDIMGENEISLEDLVLQYFDASTLQGVGISVARKEIFAHIEAMEVSGDVVRNGAKGDMIRGTGSDNYLQVMGEYFA